MTDDLPRILAALEKVDGVTVASAWPREPPVVPVVLVTLAGERAADHRDDRWYLTELEYYVRVFAAKSGELRRVLAAVDEAMRALGYDLAFRWDEPGEGWRQAAMRYKTSTGALRSLSKIPLNIGDCNQLLCLNATGTSLKINVIRHFIGFEN